MKYVLINQDFRDVYTGELYLAGGKREMTDERIAEIRSVNADFVSVIGTVPEKDYDEDTAVKPKAKAK